MEKADVWMPLFIGDYLADTGRLTTEQHGAYFLLIMDYWRNGPPPDDASVLAQITRLSADAWSIAQAQLKHLFSIEDGVWRHKRIDEELATAKENKGKAKAKAKAAADARWGKVGKDAPSNAPSNATSIPQAILEECPSPSPSPIKTKSKAEASQRATRLPDDWMPNEEEAHFCETERPDLRVEATAARFRDYWIAQPGQKGRKADWTATWRNWVRNERRVQQAAAPPRNFDPVSHVNRNRKPPP
jgi:uncharacterized protein YdaU (DUF1376 family)